jgi:hypothetical protein
MPFISVELDADLNGRVSIFANGVGVPVETVIERALKYALSSRYPDNSLPGGRPERPDQGLPRPPFNPSIDNELPGGEIPVNPDQGLPGTPDYPSQGLPGSGARPDQGLPGSQPKPDQGLPGSQPKPDQGLPGSKRNPNPNPNPDVDVDVDKDDDSKPRPKKY